MRYRHPRRAKWFSLASLRWVVRHRAFTPWYLVRYWRLLKLRLTQPDVICEGMVFLDRDTEIEARRGYGRLIIGAWTHIGRGTAIRAHEGTLRIGSKCVIGRYNTINSYLDLEIGDCGLIADWVYVSDFDHKADDLAVPIKDQGIVKTPVRIGRDVWLGTKATVTRGVRIGRGSIVGANAVVTKDVAPYSVVGGAPARLLRRRDVPKSPASAAPPAVQVASRPTRDATARDVRSRDVPARAAGVGDVGTSDAAVRGADSDATTVPDASLPVAAADTQHSAPATPASGR